MPHGLSGDSDKPYCERIDHMGKFAFHKTEIAGVFIIEPTVFGDERGYFMESYNEKEFAEAGIFCKFVQNNQSRSKKGVLRGLHYQKQYPQAKLVRVISGEVFDVAVDIRPGSATYGKWIGAVLSSENRKMFFVPKGFAHGFLVLSEAAELAYMCDAFYHPEDEGGIRWDDPTLAIAWPEMECAYILSERDQQHPPFLDETRAPS